MIHGLTPTLAEGGKIKIGGLGESRPTKDGKGTWRRPVKYDDFRITKTTRDAQGDLELDKPIMDALMKGKPPGYKLREIPIVLHSDVIEEVFPTSYAMYAEKKLNCRGDGQKATRLEIDAKGNRTGKSKEIACPCPFLNAKSGPVCKPHGTLHCSINIPGLAVAGVVHKFRTTSIMTIQRLTASLIQIRELCGTLRGIPLTLKVTAVPVTPNDAPPSTVYVVHVELRASDVLKIQQQALEVAENRRALGGNFALEYKKTVHAPGVDESPAEEAEVAQEFHSENAEAGPAPTTQDDMPREIDADPKAETTRRENSPTDDKKAPKSDEPAPTETTNFYKGAVVEVLETKTARNPKYGIKGSDGLIYATFHKSLWELAKECHSTGEHVVIQWKPGPHGRDIIEKNMIRASEAEFEPGSAG